MPRSLNTAMPAFSAAGKLLLQFPLECGFGAAEPDLEAVGKVHRVVRVAQGRHFDAAVAQPVEQRPGSVSGSHLADVMDPDVPGVALAAEGMREPPGHGVLLQHQHPVAGLRERRGAGEAAHARADHHRVPFGGSCHCSETASADIEPI
jgi:hypothetical protein